MRAQSRSVLFNTARKFVSATLSSNTDSKHFQFVAFIPPKHHFFFKRFTPTKHFHSHVSFEKQSPVFKVGDHAVKQTELEILSGKLIPVLQVLDPDPLLEQAISEGEIDPYGAILWPSSLAAAKAMINWNNLRLKHHSNKGKTFKLLEIGAGTGLVSLTALHLGGQVLSTDIFSYSLELIETASKLPCMGSYDGTLQTATFDITSKQPLPDCDIMVISDLLYDRDIARFVATRVCEASSRNISSIVADPGRDGRNDFLDELKRTEYFSEHDFHPVPIELEDSPIKNIGVLCDFHL